MALAWIGLAAAMQGFVAFVDVPEGGAPRSVVSVGLFRRAEGEGKEGARALVGKDDLGARIEGVAVPRAGHSVVRFATPEWPAGTRVVTFGPPVGAAEPAAAPTSLESPTLFASPTLLHGGGVRCVESGRTWSGRAEGSFSDGALHVAPTCDEAYVEGAWRVVEADRLRTVLGWSGSIVRHGAGRGPLNAELHVVFTPVARRAEVSLWIEATRGGRLAADVGLRFSIDGDFRAPRVAGDAYEEDYDDSSVAFDPGPPDVRESLRAPDFQGVVAAWRVPRRVLIGHVGGYAVYAPADAQRGPRATIRQARGGIVLVAAEAGDEIDEGEGRLIEATLVPSGDAPPVDLVARAPARPAALMGCGRTAHEPSPAATARIRRLLTESIAEWRIDPRRGLGWRRDDVGDWNLDMHRAGNAEWDTTAGLTLAYISGGRRVDLEQARATAWHLLLRDRDGPRSGLFFHHGFGHRTEKVEAGHHWTEGLRLFAALTDDPMLNDALPRIAADQIRGLSRVDLAVALPRSLGWGLQSLAALHDVAPDKAASRRQIERYRDFALARLLPEGHFALERRGRDEDLVRIAPFVEGGVILPALVRAERVVPHQPSRAAVKKVAAALRRDAFDVVEERRVFRSTVMVEPVRGRVVKKSGLGSGEELLLFLSGLAAAGAGDAATAAAFALAEETLAVRRKTYTGKEISMLLRALPELDR